MAIPPKNALYSLLLVSSFILGAMAVPSISCPARCEKELKWTLYARQIGGNQPNANQEEMVPSKHPATRFGSIVVNDWPVLDAPLPNATIVARARGTHTKAGPAAGDWFASLSIVFEGNRYWIIYVSVCAPPLLRSQLLEILKLLHSLIDHK